VLAPVAQLAQPLLESLGSAVGAVLAPVAQLAQPLLQPLGSAVGAVLSPLAELTQPLPSELGSVAAAPSSATGPTASSEFPGQQVASAGLGGPSTSALAGSILSDPTSGSLTSRSPAPSFPPAQPLPGQSLPDSQGASGLAGAAGHGPSPFLALGLLSLLALFLLQRVRPDKLRLLHSTPLPYLVVRPG
jgi:hypothetical protein